MANSTNNKQDEKFDLSTIEMIEYANAVAYMASTNSRDIFKNSGNNHAAIVFQNIFKHSKYKIRILAGNLRNEVTSSFEYQSALILFLRNPNAQLEILLDRFDCKDDINKIPSPLFKILYPYKHKIKIKGVDTETVMTDVNGNNNQVHFCTGDDRMYRLELDIKDRKAECCFNNKEYVNILSSYFDNLMKDEGSKKIEWSELIN